MLYRKSEFKKHKYFLKSIHGLWILPIVIINLIVPLFNFLQITTLIISKKPGNTGISRDIRTEFTTDLLLSD